MGRRERILLAAEPQFPFVQLPPDLSALFQVTIRLGDVGGRRRIGCGGYLVAVIGVDACVDAFFLGETGELVIVEVRGRTAMFPAVPVKLLSWRIWICCSSACSSVPGARMLPRARSDATPAPARPAMGGTRAAPLRSSA